MTPPDQPEEAPSALSRLERALAGFGEPKAPPAPEPEPEVVAEEPEPESEVVAEAEPEPVDEEPEAEEPEAEEPEPEEPGAEESEAEDDAWAAPASSVLDIAAAVAAVERLGSTPAPPPLPSAAPSDADALVLAATAAGTAAPRHTELDREDDEGERPRFEPADLRARIQEFATEEGVPDLEEAEAADEPEFGGDAPYFLADEPEPREEPVAEPEAWQRNIGDTTLPYFLVEDNAAPLPVPPDPIAQVEELRQAIVRPPKTEEPKQPVSIARTLAEIPVLLIVAALIAFLVKTFLAQAYYIPSGSMLPQLQIDDRVVVSKLAFKAHDPRRGDIIVFDDPRTGAAAAKSDEGLLRKVGEGIGIVQPSTDEFIKRVIGLPGETVEGKNGHVYINGRRLIEPYLKDTVVTSDFEQQTVKPGRLWVMGDNRTGSADSRVFGQIKIDTIVGRALVKVWPLDHVSFL